MPTFLVNFMTSILGFLLALPDHCNRIARDASASRHDNGTERCRSVIPKVGAIEPQSPTRVRSLKSPLKTLLSFVLHNSYFLLLTSRYSISTIVAIRSSSSLTLSPSSAASSALPRGEIQLTASG